MMKQAFIDVKDKYSLLPVT